MWGRPLGRPRAGQDLRLPVRFANHWEVVLPLAADVIRAIIDLMSLSLAIKERALEIGFDLAGVAPLGIWRDLEFSRQWVERGYGGEMHYLENPKRCDPRQVLPSAKSVVCVGLIYNTAHAYSTELPWGAGPCAPTVPPDEGRAAAHEGDEQPDAAGPRAWISRYAWGEDYHEVMCEKLEELRAGLEALAPGAETRAYVDTGPIVERAFARYSGIGWVGKNTCLINEKKGSWFFLGVMLTSLELEPDLPAPDRCGSCTQCIEACPTGALVEPYVMDASRCIAYFTIELKGSIPKQFRDRMGANVFGCDICQDVCPWNARPRAAATQLAEFQPMRAKVADPLGSHDERALSPRPCSPVNGPTTNQYSDSSWPRSRAPRNEFSLFNPSLEALASLSEEDFRRVFAHSPVKRARYRGWLRNLCVAMGNSGDARFVPWLERAREHPDSIVREHAEWALRRLDRLRNE